LRAYARLALEIEPAAEDVAWLLTDVLAATSEADGPDEIAAQLADAVPAGQEPEIFEVMWRLPHPSAGEVLTLLGTHHPDKQIAKAARKAAFKAGSHGDLADLLGIPLRGPVPQGQQAADDQRDGHPEER